MRRSTLALALLALACADRTVGASGGGEGSESTAGGSSGSPSTSSTTTSTNTSTSTTGATTTTSESSASTAGSDTGAETGEVPTCVEGTWYGWWTSGFEWGGFQECGSSEWWWFAGGPYCPEAYIGVEGTLCGPGNYGHLGQSDYELTGTVVLACLGGGCGEPTSLCGESSTLCGAIECDPVVSDCPVGKKCVPTGPEAGPWNGTKCELDIPMPAGEGEPCTWSPQGGDCDDGLHCGIIDAVAGTGVCAPYCYLDAPSCAVCDGCGGEAPADFFGVCLSVCPGPDDPCVSC